MKTHYAIIVTAVLALISSGVQDLQALEPGKRLTRQQLEELRGSAQEKNMKLKPVEAAVDKAHPSQSSILDRSVILSDGRNWTFVPKGSVFIKPELFQEKVGGKPSVNYLSFDEFFIKNRGWITTFPVTLEQARGNAPIPEKKRDALVKAGRVVVTTFKGGAISTRPFKSELATAQK